MTRSIPITRPTDAWEFVDRCVEVGTHASTDAAVQAARDLLQAQETHPPDERG